MVSGPLITNMSTIQGSPKYSMRGKASNSSRVETPGPGSYTSAGPEANKYNKTASFGFGSAPRDLMRPSSAPGPGQYTPADPRNTSSQYGFGSSTRKGAPSRVDQPGPGAYTLSPRVGAEGPKPTMSGKRNGNMKSLAPGPGAYQAPLEGQGNKEIASPKFGFGTAPREYGAVSANPGPGSYNYNADDIQFAGPKFSMRSQLSAGSRPETPGPGAHGGSWTQFG